jgi:tetratricopeptide (TPR) repeat protein
VKRTALSLCLLGLAGIARIGAAQDANPDEILDLVNASLTAGEGLPATALLEKYLQQFEPTPEVEELEILAAFYSGDYGSAAERIRELQASDPSTVDLGQLAQIIVDTEATLRDYEQQSHEHFSVRYAPGPDELLVPYAISTLKAIEAVLERELGIRMVSPIRIEIYPDAESLAKVSTLSVESIRNTGTIALCKWGRLMIASPRALLRGYPWLDTIAHEYVHLVLTKASLDRAPVWLQEGTAKFYETSWREPSPALNLDPGSEQLLLEAAKKDSLLSFDQLHPSIALLPSQTDAALAFAQVSSFMDMFYKGHGAAGIKTALNAIADGTDARQAISKVAGEPWKRVEKEWREQLKQRPDPPVAARLIPKHLSEEANENDELANVELEKARKHARLGDLLWTRARPAAASVEYAKAHEAAPTDPIVASRYARSALEGGHPERAIEPLKATLALYPSHAPAHAALADALFSVGDTVAAKDAAQAAIAHNPFDPRPHCILAALDLPHAEHEAELCSQLGGKGK